MAKGLLKVAASLIWVYSYLTLGFMLAVAAVPGWFLMQWGWALDVAPQRERFFNAMDDDLWTPGAIAACREVADAIHATAAAGRDVAPAQTVLREMAAVLGLWLDLSPPTP